MNPMFSNIDLKMRYNLVLLFRIDLKDVKQDAVVPRCDWVIFRREQSFPHLERQSRLLTVEVSYGKSHYRSHYKVIKADGNTRGKNESAPYHLQSAVQLNSHLKENKIILEKKIEAQKIEERYNYLLRSSKIESWVQELITSPYYD